MRAFLPIWLKIAYFQMIISYLQCGCTPNKNVVCDDITSNWNNLKTKISLLSDSGITVNFIYFETRNYNKKAFEI